MSWGKSKAEQTAKTLAGYSDGRYRHVIDGLFGPQGEEIVVDDNLLTGPQGELIVITPPDDEEAT